MTDPPSRPNSGERAGIPRWVMVSGIVVAVLALVIVAIMLLGGGHQPRPHGMTTASPAEIHVGEGN